ncbi:MAG: hypothetical protein H6833_07125 [Planctomycetes bacterium]|nr:hypothetical protein [Planctomycetota bacterium]
MNVISPARKLPPGAVIPLRETLLGLATLVIPGAGFIAGLAFLAGRDGYPDLFDMGSYPWELWVIGFTGTLATICGFLDWHYHVTGRRPVAKRERHGELIALTFGGAPLFVLMALASVTRNPMGYLLPIVLVALFTTVVICYDEFVFHRKACKPYETLLHRGLVLGNGTAWLAWMHWCFVRVAVHG